LKVKSKLCNWLPGFKSIVPAESKPAKEPGAAIPKRFTVAVSKSSLTGAIVY
jgi:hypothetical protein